MFATARSGLQSLIRPWQSRRRHVMGAVLAAFSLTTILAVAPPPPASAADLFEAYLTTHAQTLGTADANAADGLVRDSYSATDGIQTLITSGTNYDWAKMVMLAGGWPMSDNNVTVFLRWMRQENGADNWWNRNNPLNNGFGSGGGGGTGTYANLVIAAQKAAENLKRHPGFAPIVANFAASSPTAVTEASIWASPWATGHYANGAHWHYTPVTVVKAPAGAWQ
jgi:hypothetical protein